MTATCEIVRLRSIHAPALTELFSRISADVASRHFHPHAFQAEDARRICAHEGEDRYMGVFVDRHCVAYGMLRGWDEGFDVPSLGIYVDVLARGRGVSTLLMQHLHVVARLSGAPAVRLKVYPDNTRARALYEGLGYRFADDPVPDQQLLGMLDL